MNLTPTVPFLDSTGAGAVWGNDVSTFPTLDPTFTPISGRRAVAEAVLRRWFTPPGALIEAPDYGYDLRARLNAKMRASDLYRTQAELQAEAEKDDRVASASVTCSFSPSTMTLAVVGVLKLATDTSPVKVTFAMALTGASGGPGSLDSMLDLEIG